MQVYLIAIKIFKDFRQIMRPAAYETLIFADTKVYVLTLNINISQCLLCFLNKHLN